MLGGGVGRASQRRPEGWGHRRSRPPGPPAAALILIIPAILQAYPGTSLSSLLPLRGGLAGSAYGSRDVCFPPATLTVKTFHDAP